LYHTKTVSEKLQAALGEDFYVTYAMRYKNPSLPSVLESMRKMNFSKIIVVPMFPQYASSSTGSALQRVMEIISKWYVIPEINIISQYYDHPGYIRAFTEIGKKYNWQSYDHVIFSFHGVPERQVDKVYEDGLCADRHCEQGVTDENKFCYKAVCFETARQIAQSLDMPEGAFTVGFQSRLGRDPWLEPSTEHLVEQMGKEGKKKLLVFSPAFTADCLETTIEIGEEYKELFEEHGGEHLQLVESLNSHPLWVDTLKSLVLERAQPGRTAFAPSESLVL
jgi:ferrochelatase